MKKSELLSNTGLSAEAVNALESIGITTVEEICELSEEKLFSISNVGVKSLKDILSLIKKCNKQFSSDLSKSQNLDEWKAKNSIQILNYVRKNDISIYDMNLSAKAFNTLRINDYLLLSQFVLKTNAEINDICFENRNVSEEIILYVREWLFINRSNILPLSACIDTLDGYKGDDPLSRKVNNTGNVCHSVIQEELGNYITKEKYIQYAEQYNVPIEKLNLSKRAYNCLKINRVNMLSDVIIFYPNGYAKMRNVGSKTVDEIKNCVELFFLNCNSKIEADTIGLNEESHKLLAVNDLSDIQLFYNSNTKDLAWKYIKKNDIAITSLNFSVRTMSALLSAKINNFSSLLEIYLTDTFMLKNIGTKSIREIKSIVQARIAKIRPSLVAYCSGNTQSLFSDEYIEDTVLEQFDNKAFVGVSFKEIKEKFSEEVDESRIKKAIGKLIHNGVLEYVDFRCYRVYPSFFDVFNKKSDLKDNSSKDYLLRKYNGETFESIAQSEGITRERVRQICNKQNREIKNGYFAETGLEYFDEDYYAYLYSTYDVSKEFLKNYLNLQIRTLYYLKNTYTIGHKALSTAINDSKLDINMKLRIRDYLNKDKILINQTLLEPNRVSIENYVLENYCADELKYSEFVQIYNDVLNENKIDNPDLFLTDEVARTRSNRLSDSKKCLWKQGERLRYYDIESRDYTELFEVINLGEYSNIEVSTLKFIEEYPEIMEKYDIRDQYELHNLLKKTIGNDNGLEHDVHFGRQPIVSFGKSDRFELYLKILNIISPVTADEFCEYIHMENGFDKQTILASPEMRQLSKYYHGGVYSINFKHLPEYHATMLSTLLENDFYYIDEIIKIYKKNFADADVECINPRALKSIGFKVFSNYAIKNYSTAEAYFRNLLTKDDVFDIAPYRAKYGTIVIYNQLVMDLRREHEICLFENNQYINIRRLSKAGVTKQMIEDFCHEVNDIVPSNTYFTIQSLRNDGFSHSLDNLGFSDVFYSGLLSVSPFFCHQRVYGSIVLYAGNNNKKFSIKSFIQNMLEQYDGIDVDDFIDDMFEKYGIRFPEKYAVTGAVAGTDMYYDSIMNKIYPNKNQYYSDLDN